MWWVIDPPEERNAHEILRFPPVMCLRLMKLLLSGCSLISTIMDIVHQCLSLVPVPHLAPAFTSLKFIYSFVPQVQTIQQQVDVLVQFVAQLLYTLDKEYRTERLLQNETSVSLANLSRFVRFSVPLS